MATDNDTIIIFSPQQQREIKPISKPKPRIEKIETGIIKNIRMDIEELREIKGADLRKDTRSDIFMGNEIDRSQRESIHKEGKVYVRGHTKIVNKKVRVVKPYLRNK